MVTSNKLPDKKVVKMAEQNNSVVVPQRTLLGKVNEHITCPLCRGYYIDATTIVECLHSFCRSCIIKHLQVKSYCPVCEMMINSAKPNIKLDKALQDIVYKLVPGLFQREMERRQTFYASRPGPAASATPEQRGEDTERIIFSPEDVISFSLEYADATDTDSISSKSSDSNESQLIPASARRYLQCPAVVNVSHLKKFISMKFDIDSTQFAIDILYKRVPLPDYYTLMDIAYIYNWKRNEPMRFFYQIIDFAMRNRFFDINRKGTHFHDRKSSPASTEDMHASSPAPHLNDQGSEASSGTDSPMPEDNNSKQMTDYSKKTDKCGQLGKVSGAQDNSNKSGQSIPKKNDDEVEKSQFLNSFELTAKSSTSAKSSPVKNNTMENVTATAEPPPKNQTTPPKSEDSLKRKHQPLPNMSEMKKLKIEIEKTKFKDLPLHGNASHSNSSSKVTEAPVKPKEMEKNTKTAQIAPPPSKPLAGPGTTKESKQQVPAVKQPPDSPGAKRPVPTASQSISSPKRKLNDTFMPSQQPSTAPKTVSPLKLQFPKSEPPISTTSRPIDLQKPAVKKIPDLKPSFPMPQSSLNKGQPTNRVRMDLLANNSDPTIDRSKILSQVKTSLSMQSPVPTSGDPLKSLFDSCKINIPSSLSITLTDQKQDTRNPNERDNPPSDPKKNVVNKNFAGANNSNSHKIPSPPVHNYIEILKLPDTDPKKQTKPEGNSDNRSNTPNKTDQATPQPKPPSKSSETSAKGPVPNLKPIADTKLGKQSSTTTNTSSSYPVTFQQTFEQQLLSQSDKKPKLPKNKAQVPKLVPANPKTFNAAATKMNNPSTKPSPSSIVPPVEIKPSTALDLTTPSNMQSQLTPHQTKVFETMQSKAFEIANLAKKQNLTSNVPPPGIPHNFSSISNRPIPTNAPLRLPPMTNINQLRQEKAPTGASSSSGLTNSPRQDMSSKSNPLKLATSPSPMSSASYQLPSHSSPSPAQPSPRQTRSPSSSPKLVIAEEKQTTHSELNVNQSNQISSTQAPNNSVPKSESPKILPGPSKPGPKPMKPMPPVNKITGIRQPIPPTVKLNPTPADFMSAHHALLRNMEINAWLKAQRFMSSMAHQAQNDFNKDKQ